LGKVFPLRETPEKKNGIRMGRKRLKRVRERVVGLRAS